MLSHVAHPRCSTDSSEDLCRRVYSKILKGRNEPHRHIVHHEMHYFVFISLTGWWECQQQQLLQDEPCGLMPRCQDLPSSQSDDVTDVSRTWLAVNELPELVHRQSTWQRERLWEADGSRVKHEATRRAMGNEELTVRFLIMDHTGCLCLRLLWTIKHWHQVTSIWLEVLTGNTDDSAWITTLHIVKGSCLPNLDVPGWHSQGRRKHQQELVAALANQPTKDAVYIWASHALHQTYPRNEKHDQWKHDQKNLRFMDVIGNWWKSNEISRVSESLPQKT